MWCNRCGQDVVGVKSEEAGRYQCPRCKGVVCDRIQAATPVTVASPRGALDCGDSSPISVERQLTDLPEPSPLDTWELDEQLRHVARLLHFKAGGGASPTRARLDPAQPAAPGWHRAGPRRAAKPNHAPPDRKPRWGAILSSASTWLGVTALTCGGSLLGWAEFTLRGELQIIGFVITIGGVLMLALGMTLRLGQSEERFTVPSTRHRVDPKSPNSRSGPHARHPVRHQSDKAA